MNRRGELARTVPLRTDPERVAEWRKRSRKPIPRPGRIVPVSVDRAQAVAEGTVKSAATRRSTLGPGKDTGPDQETREKVYDRDGGCCTCGCRTPIEGRPHSVGHRKRRSQGGGNEMSNLLTFLGLGRNPLDTDDHHARIDSRRNPKDEAQGFTVRSQFDPAQVPVLWTREDGSTRQAWLWDDGTVSYDGPQEAAA